ncbi:MULTISPECIES: sigma-70 family RNA polymerase sigma factor [Gimesia]|uniref:Sigma-70 family RNA polymerase sigma factor n=2 Tax=Gimesia TaxID=1649453 RepID=A0A6I6AD95_9PLAN|nr:MULTISPECIES: sigma-70 family RNA polymerase sigma factor [Gimesia]KAA0140691.1 sigma-70 family RNA polymerase sigma factor [Gimesia chilikensis]MBN70145.1 RNA polymerase subunit sigma [Gimesia sp.]MCR9229772.1 sigma-70 family RNA polymerase sigma factor [bacterium]QGQ24297.1 sigma-70 family RNA polymerase sigma factor [Gimesia benthica]
MTSSTDLPAFPDTSSEESREFISLFTRHQRRIYLYILSMIPHPLEAEEILQNTNLVIWKKAAQFEVGTNFFAWACQIAHYEILKYRKKRGRDKHQFSDEFVSQVAEAVKENQDLFELRRNALTFCLAKLRKKDRELIQRRYQGSNQGKELADDLGRPVNSVYQSLGRVRRTLFECINRYIAAESYSHE